MRAIDLPTAQALLASIPEAAGLIRRPEVAEAWRDASDLPGYTVGGVAGHLLRAVSRLEPTLKAAAPDGELAPLTEWYLLNRVTSGEDLDGELPRLLRQDGEQLAAQGPESLADELDGLSRRLHERLAGEDADRTVGVVLTRRPVLLGDYLASRLLEVVVHADDVAFGAGTATPEMPGPVADAATAFLLRLARARSGDLAVLRAFTRAGRTETSGDVLRVL